MTRKCFFVPDINPVQEYIVLERDCGHHIINVLRLEVGDRIELRDGRKNGCTGVIAGIEDGRVRVRLLDSSVKENESALRLTLSIPFTQSDKMDLVLRQATELGVHRIVAFRAQRSQYGLSGQQAQRRHQRWNKIAQESLCQCGRTALPEILFLPSVTDLISLSSRLVGSGGLKILASESERERSLVDLWHLSHTYSDMVVVVGPEGGWTSEEEDCFAKSGFVAVHLGPRVLRFETAAVALTTSVQLLWGDFR